MRVFLLHSKVVKGGDENNGKSDNKSADFPVLEAFKITKIVIHGMPEFVGYLPPP